MAKQLLSYTASILLSQSRPFRCPLPKQQPKPISDDRVNNGSMSETQSISGRRKASMPEAHSVSGRLKAYMLCQWEYKNVQKRTNLKAHSVSGRLNSKVIHSRSVCLENSGEITVKSMKKILFNCKTILSPILSPFDKFSSDPTEEKKVRSYFTLGPQSIQTLPLSFTLIFPFF